MTENTIKSDVIKIAKAAYTITNINQPLYVPPVNKIVVSGFQSDYNSLFNYHELIKICRWFYTFDPIAGTVIERMTDMAITELRNKRKGKRNTKELDQETLAYFDAVAERIRPFLKLIALEYFIHGMAVPAYNLEFVKASTFTEYLGRKKVWMPSEMWVRNPENIVLKRRPVGTERQVYLKIPANSIHFVTTKGYHLDGTYDPEGYALLVEKSPEYISQINSGNTYLHIRDARPILRKENSYNDYPTPFLTKALKALQHKESIKQLDRSLANHAIEAIRHTKIGNDTIPATDEDIEAAKMLLNQPGSSAERVYNLVTSHLQTIEWVIPPLDALLTPEKYDEPNADIFLGLGFPRILTVGETLRSNSSDAKTAVLGPKATLEDLRDHIIVWLKTLYLELAEKNGFTQVPEPYFNPIQTIDYTTLVQFAKDALASGTISRNKVSELYGSDYDTEARQIESEREQGILSPTELAVKQTQDFTVQQSETAYQRQQEMAAQNNTNNNTARDQDD